MMKYDIDITKYETYFHDGSLIKVQYIQKDELVLSMISSEMSPHDFKETLPLSSNNTLRGELHLKGISKLYVDKIKTDNKLKLKNDDGEIMHFEITQNKIVKIHFFEVDFNEKNSEPPFIQWEIHAKEISWKTIPTLPDFAN